MATKRDYYEVLGVSRSCTEDDLKSPTSGEAVSPDVNKEADAESR
jgi:molecular chaperone DnaJ